MLPACAPRAVVKPIPSDTPPEKVLEMVKAKEEGIQGIRASVKVTVQAEGREPQGFDAVLYAARPDKVRLTGLAMMGYTVFDVVLTGDKFYFYQPDDGWLYTGPRASLRGFLEERGVKADPETIYRSLFLNGPGVGGRYLYDRSEDGYVLYTASEKDGLFVPAMKAEYDAGLELRRKVFYDGLARPYLYVEHEGAIEEGGYRLPERLRARDTRGGYTVTVAFEKYLVNPEGMDEDFTIRGGELKGIREVE